MDRGQRISTMVVRLLTFITVVLFSSTAFAHLSTFGSWETTEKYLNTLFPEATKYRIKSDKYSAEQVKMIEAKLGFELYPEDLTPTFYIAIKEEGDKKTFLGVAIFIDPRLKNESVARFDVGVAVDRKGRIHRIRVFENRALRKLAEPSFLDQFLGFNEKSNFDLKTNKKVKSVTNAEQESQLVSNAAYEALYLMKISLSKKK